MDVDLRTTELGQTFSFSELSRHCRAVWGGVSWPSERPGFAVVIGMSHEPHFDSYDVFLLDEYESFDMRTLIRQCGALDLKYAIPLFGEFGQWIGDFKNDAASRFIEEMNSERQQANPNSHAIRKHFSLSGTVMLEMENLYSYIVPQIKEWAVQERKMLFLKHGNVANYLAQIEKREGEITSLKLGDYPAIEALAFAVIELRQQQAIRVQEPQQSPWDDNVLLGGFGGRRGGRR